jgi:hypothetical protein
MYDLSIVIPALREEFLALTVEDIVKNKRGKTEVIVVLDGEWAKPQITDHPDVRIIHTANRGQRGATNLGVRLSRAKWVAKCDAHCAFDEGFDLKLLEAVEGHDDWTIVPVMRNMHIFNWRCMDCGDESYQGPEPEGCKNCNVNTPDRFEKKIVWFPKPSPNSSAYKFTPNRLQFKYFGALKNKQQKEGGVVETMSLQGSFFMLTREKYWELNICDESWGGWGQQGTEVALKTWLSGGRVVCNLDTWYAHMFRTQSGFAFPWGNPGKQQDKARKTSWELFYKNRWDKQIRPLSWLIERFWDELQQEPNKDDDPRWTQEHLNEIKSTEGRFNGQPTKGILYFTDNELPYRLAKNVRSRITKIAQDKEMALVSSSRKRIDNMGINVVTRKPRGYLTMFEQILKGLEALNTDIVFMAEHDVLYPPEHFDFIPADKDVFYYDTNWYKVHTDGVVVRWKADQVSGLCAYRDKLIEYYKYRIDTFDKDNFDRKFEPFSGEKSAQWEAGVPHIDIRHGHNLTYDKRSLDHFRNKDTAINFETTTIDKIPGWENLDKLLDL